MHVPPNEQRNFVHKRILGAAIGFVTGGPGGAVGGALRGGGRPTQASIARGGLDLASRCAAKGRVPDPTRPGKCTIPGRVARPGIVGTVQRFLPGGATGFVEGGGEAVMGRFGAALVPGSEEVLTLDCLPGMVLGKDELCYNRRDIRNSDRKWPRGRRPLGTPGELAALAKAARFGRRMESTVKRMQSIGVLKKPARAKARAPKPKMLTSGAGVSVVNVE